MLQKCDKNFDRSFEAAISPEATSRQQATATFYKVGRCKFSKKKGVDGALCPRKHPPTCRAFDYKGLDGCNSQSCPKRLAGEKRDSATGIILHISARGSCLRKRRKKEEDRRYINRPSLCLTQPCNFHSILTTAISMPSFTWREEVVNVGYSIQSTQEGEPPFVQHWH